MQEIHAFHQLKRMSFCLGFEHMLQGYLGSVSQGFDPSSSSHKTLWGVFLFVSLGLEAVYAVLSEEPCNAVGHRPNFEYGSSFQEVIGKV